MKRNLIGFLVLMLLIVQQSYSQKSFTVKEDFDGVNPAKFTVPQGTWVYNTDYYQPSLTGAAVPRSFLARVPSQKGDTIILQLGGGLDFFGYTNVELRFNHICKVSPNDITKIQYRIGLGSWTDFDERDALYLGSATNHTFARGFNAASYAEWDADDSTAIPDQDWWREEVFDMSVDLRGFDDVEFRFMIVRGNVDYSDDSFGWLLENIQVTASDYIISQPVVEFLSPLIKDMVYRTGPWEINARVEATTNAPIRNPELIYTVTEPGKQPVTYSILMTHVSGNAYWKATIPQYIAGTEITYSITGRDTNGNEATASSGYYIKRFCGGGGGGSSTVYNYSYTESMQTVQLVPGTYELECWGANGESSNNNRAGTGGYSKGNLTLSSVTTLYIVVGGKPSGTTTGLQPGGYNGGGSGWAASTGRAGGGATHIAKRTGLLSSLESYKSDVIIVAGGGGGDQNTGTIGHGGGLSGTGTYPGTQTGSSGGSTALAGTFGQGGNITTSYGGGGGGGWFGGGGDQNNSGSGGSGYIGGVTNGVTDGLGGSTFITNLDPSGHGFVRITTISIGSGDCSDNSASTYSIDIPDTVATSPTIQIPIIATVKNTGVLDLSSAIVSYSVNGSTPISATWYFNPALPWDYSSQDTLGYYTPQANRYDTILVWVSMPNGYIDTNTFDDTLTKLVYGASDILAAFIDSPADTVYATGPYEIKASIKSISGLSLPASVSLNVTYTYQGITTQEILDMQLDVSDSLWKVIIPQKRFNNNVVYSVNLTDILGNDILLLNSYYIKRSCEGTTNGCDTNSVGLVSIDSPLRMGTLAGNNIPVQITLSNKGVADLDSCYINWSLNGVVQPDTTIYYGPLPDGFTDTITIGWYVPVLDKRDTIAVWVSLPNGHVDSTTSDDTLIVMPLGCKIVLSGEHFIGTGGTFTTLSDALTSIRECGIAGDVILSMLPGTYISNDISYNASLYDNYKLTITSSTGNANDVTFISTIRFNNASNIILKDITIDVASSSNNGIEFAGTCSAIEINGCTIKVSPTTATSTVRGISYANTSGSGNQLTNISIVNNTIDGGYYNIYLYYLGGANGQGRNNRIDNNTLTNAYNMGIYIYYYGHLKSVSNNTIITRDTTVGQYGMYFYYYNNVDTVVNNKILLKGRSSTNYGISLYYYTNRTAYGATQLAFVANNEIRHLNVLGTTYGIYTYYASADIFHNSVYLKGTSTAYAMYINTTSTTDTLNIKNNIFSVATSGTGYPIYVGTATYSTQAYNTTLDYNDYYSTGSSVGYIAAAKSSLADLRISTGQDANSVSVSPSFIDVNSSLNLNRSVGLMCPIIPSVTSDIRDTSRIVITNMGCYDVNTYEGNATLWEITGVTDGNSPGQTEDVKVVVYNTGTTDLTSINLEWSVDGVSKGSNDYPVSLSRGNSTTITIGQITYPSANVVVKVWINNLNNNSLPDESPMDDTLSRFVVVCNGTYGGILKVGTSAGAFSTLSYLYQALTACGVSSDIIIQFEPGTYTEGVGISNNAPIFGNHKLTITSSTGNANDVTFNSTARFNTASNIILKDITVDVTSTGASGVEFVGNCSDIEVNGCIIKVNPKTADAATRGISYANTSGSGNQLTNISIVNNTIDGGYYNIYLYYLGGANGQGRNNRIDNNTLTNAYNMGIYTYYYGHLKSVSNNTIITRDTTVGQYGIYLYYYLCVDTIVNNKILLKGRSSTNYGIYLNYYINRTAYGATQRAFIVNNEVRHLNVLGTTYGIMTYYASADIFHNSVYLKGTSTAYAMYINTTSTTDTLNIKNNIFSVATSGTGYPIYVGTATHATLAFNTTLDYNDYHSTGANVGYIAAAVTTMDALRTATGQDVNSVNIRPSYADTSISLELSHYNDTLECPLNNSVLTDILGSNRFAITTMGAYSTQPGAFDVRVLKITPWNTEVVKDQVVQINADILNGGTATVSSVTFGWSLNGNPQPSITVPVSPALGTFEQSSVLIDDFTVTSSTNNYNIVVWVERVNGQADLLTKNDTVRASAELMPLAEFAAPFIGDTIGSLSFDVNVKIRDFTGAPVNTPEMYIETTLDGSCYIHTYDTIIMIQDGDIWVASIPKQYYGSKIIYTLHVSDTKGNSITLMDSTYIEFSGGGGTGKSTDYSYTGDIQTVTLNAGTYQFETWGADGGLGNYNSGTVPQSQITGGYGGYSVGTITLNSTTTFYIVVGGKGADGFQNTTAPGGYNGGGNGSTAATHRGGGGGGATHIATAAGILSSLESNKATVMIVAGGGGGGGNQSIGGDGGGLNGIQPMTSTQFSSRTAGQGGTQTAGGICYTSGSGAGFGQGGTTTQNLAGGGGGGWYGGCTGDNSTGGGGGSGYIGGITNGVTIDVSQIDFVASPDSTGNGYVRITKFSSEVYDISNNLAIYELMSPINNSDSICSPDYLPVEIALSNLGLNDYDFTQDNITLGYEITNPRGVIYRADIAIDTGGLLSGESKTIELMSSLPVIAGQYIIKAWVTSIIDNFTCDDTLIATYASSKIGLPIQEDFSMGIPSEFISSVINGNSKWEWYGGSAEIQPDSGTAMIRFNGAPGSRARLSTGQLDLYQAANPFVEFWYYHDNTASASDYSETKLNVMVNDVEHNLATIYLRDPLGRHGWTYYRHDLSNFTTGNDCILIQFESRNRYEGTAQYIDYIRMSSEADAAVSEIIITPELALCSSSGSDISVVIEAPRAQSISFDNTDSLILDINGTKYSVSLQGKVLQGNTSETIPVLSNFTVPVGITSMKAYFSSPVDNMPANDTAKHTIDISPGFDIRIQTISTQQDRVAAEFKHSQIIAVENTGNVDLPNIGLILTVTASDVGYHFTTKETVGRSLAPKEIDTIEFDAYTVPWSDDYQVVVHGYLICDSAMLNKSFSEQEFVDLNDLIMVDIIKPADDGTIDTVGSRMEVEVKIKNRNQTTYNPGEVKVGILITDIDGTPQTGNPTPEEYPYVINGKEEVSHTFGAKYTVPPLEEYYLVVYIEQKGQYTQNDTLKMRRRTDDDVSISNLKGALFTMEQNIPNPAKDNTIINYSIPQDGEIIFHVYSVSGQLLYSQKENTLSGEHQIELDIANYASGIYFYTMEYKGQRISKRMSITR